MFSIEKARRLLAEQGHDGTDHSCSICTLLTEIERLKAELDLSWRAALEQGKENTRLQDIIRRNAAAMVVETDKAVQP